MRWRLRAALAVLPNTSPRLLQLAALRGRSNDFKELEIVVLRHELAMPRRHTSRPTMTTIDRLFLAATSRLLSEWSGCVQRRDRLGGLIHEYAAAA
jgi:hypothetical protein